MGVDAVAVVVVKLQSTQFLSLLSLTTNDRLNTVVVGASRVPLWESNMLPR